MDAHTWPANPGERLVELIPGICLALALAVKPFVHNARGAIDIGVTPWRVVRDSVVVQVSLHACFGTFEHFAFTQFRPRAARPTGELSQTARQLFAGGSAFDLEVAALGLPAIVGETQEGKLPIWKPRTRRIRSPDSAKSRSLAIWEESEMGSSISPGPTRTGMTPHNSPMRRQVASCDETVTTGADGRAALTSLADMPHGDTTKIMRTRRSRDNKAVALPTATPKGTGRVTWSRENDPKAP